MSKTLAWKLFNELGSVGCNCLASRSAPTLFFLLVLFMGSMNLSAGLQNFGCSFIYFAVLLEIAFILLFLMVNISRQKRALGLV